MGQTKLFFASVSLLPLALLFGAAPVVAQTSSASTSDSQAGQDSGRGAPPAAADAANGSDGIRDIIVTAERRETNLQSTPISITALTADALADRNVTNLTDMAQLAPNLVVSSGTVSSNDGNYFIRGIGQQDAFSNVEPGVGTYLDGVYLGRTSGAALDLVDLERVEVLRGPQGTLFGRNTIGGAINITTAKPRPEFGGRALLRAGERHRLDAGLSMDVPLIPDLLLSKISFISRRIDGPVPNLGPAGGRAGDDRTLAGRAAFLLTPASNLTVSATLDGTRKKGTGQCSYNFGVNTSSRGVPAGAALDYSPDRETCYSSIVNNRARVETWGTALTVAWDLGPVTLKSITAYRHLKQYAPVDNDGTTFNLYDLLIDKRQHQFSQELQAYGSSLDSRLDWLVGLYYFDEKIREQQRLTFATLGSNYFRLRDFSPSTRSYAAFGQATLHVTDRLSATAGLRWTEDHKRMLANNNDERSGTLIPIVNSSAAKTWSAVTSKFGLQYQFPDLLVYASYSEGFRGGGFNARVRNAGQLIAFDPEKAKVYEAGAKIDALNQRLRLNLAGFYTDYRNIQILALQSGFFSNRNAGDARIYGFEAELTAKPVRAISINAGLGYTNARYKNLLPGIGLTTASPLPYVPRWNATVGAQYQDEVAGLGKVTARIDYSYRSSQNVFTPTSLQPAYSLVNARLALDLSRTTQLALYGRNLFDKKYAVYRSVDLSGAPGSLGIANEFLGERRELGAEITVRF